MKRLLIILSLALASPAAAQDSALIFSYANITTDKTSVLKSTPGYLHTVCINTPAATGTATIYDNSAASGTKICHDHELCQCDGLFHLRRRVLDRVDDRHGDSSA